MLLYPTLRYQVVEISVRQNWKLLLPFRSLAILFI